MRRDEVRKGTLVECVSLKRNWSFAVNHRTSQLGWQFRKKKVAPAHGTEDENSSFEEETTAIVVYLGLLHFV